ncbi:hypothetical protein [Polyangium fumosum]|uniref:hypothetical protein n=1 Tax=Polyangium fumosum TaxID=889272 RepID=UPI0014784D51|nr:hypothetical protein [Polyangium fumosum]
MNSFVDGAVRPCCLSFVLVAALSGGCSSTKHPTEEWISAPSRSLFAPSGGVASFQDVDELPGGVAFDGSHYRVVWTQRPDPQFGIWSHRIATDGTVDPAGPQLIDAPVIAEDPALAFDGTNHLLVWVDRSTSMEEGNVYAARVTVDGTTLDPGGFPIATGVANQVEPSVSYGDGQFLVAWVERGSVDTIRAARVTTDGVVSDPGGFVVAQAAAPVWFGELAFGANTFCAVYSDTGGTLRGAFIGPGADIVAFGLPKENAAYWSRPAVGSNGTEFLLAWVDGNDDDRMKGMRMGPSGAIGVPFVIYHDPENLGGFNTPMIVHNHEKYVVAWLDQWTFKSGYVSAASVSDDGAPSARIFLGQAVDSRRLRGAAGITGQALFVHASRGSDGDLEMLRSFLNATPGEGDGGAGGDGGIGGMGDAGGAGGAVGTGGVGGAGDAVGTGGAGSAGGAVGMGGAGQGAGDIDPSHAESSMSSGGGRGATPGVEGACRAATPGAPSGSSAFALVLLGLLLRRRASRGARRQGTS